MKKSVLYYFSVLFALLTILSSCNKDAEEVVVNNRQSDLEYAKSVIASIGFDTSTVYLKDDFYFIEDCITIHKDSIKLYDKRTKQNYNRYIVSRARTTITIGVDGTVPQSTNWRQAAKDAVSLYNSLNLGLEFIYSENYPNIRIKMGVRPDTYICATGEFPASNGAPGSTITINSDFFVNIHTYLTLSQKTFLLVHEIGHNLGLHHTDLPAGGDVIHYPGTPSSDGMSVMQSATCGYSWNGFSQGDVTMLYGLWPSKALTKYQTLSITKHNSIIANSTVTFRAHDGGEYDFNILRVAEAKWEWYYDKNVSVSYNSNKSEIYVKFNEVSQQPFTLRVAGKTASGEWTDFSPGFYFW